jgi:hypothetical protein
MIQPINKPLYVVSVISNPARYYTRYKLYRSFEKHVLDAGAKLITVELALGDRPFEITDSTNHNHIQLRSLHELWHKENMQRIGVSYLNHIDPQWEYVALVDADIQFVRPDWVEETVQQLQHHHVAQMFSHCIDLGPRFEPIHTHKGFAYSYVNKLRGGKAYEFWHPGYAWAMTREAWDYLGGVIDIAPLGSADHHMATAYIGKIHKSIHEGMSQSYKDYMYQWQDRALRFIKKDIGYVPGQINHYWHGKKKERFYIERWKVLIDSKFDHEKDLKLDSQGLWQLSPDNIALRDGIRQYFAARNEDSVDL